MFILKITYTLCVLIALGFAVVLAVYYLKNKKHRCSESFTKITYRLFLGFLISHVCGLMILLILSTINIMS